MNYKYLAILGRCPQLSQAEVEAQLGGEIKTLLLAQNCLFWQQDQPLDPNFLNKLGGSLKVCLVIGQVSGAEVLDLMSKYVLETITGQSKVNLGVSFYGDVQKKLGTEQKLGLSLKKKLRGKLPNSLRFVAAKIWPLSTVVVTTNKLLPQADGYEFVLSPTSSGQIVVARTLAVQDYVSYSARDYGRPKRDLKSGMLPPKLAQIMINLSQVEFNQGSNLVWDPFCGRGTVLQESLALGLPVLGSDLSAEAVSDCRVNLPSLTAEQLLVADARKYQPQVEVGAIVTEPYLGQPLHGREPREVLLQNRQQLIELYQQVFKSWARLFKPGLRVVFVIPRWPQWKLELKPSDFIDSADWLVKSSYTCGRDSARVWRDITVFIKE